MITVRPSAERGHANHGWLDSRFSFSFADYYDPKHMGFRNLRVINDDHVAGHAGFPMHPHRDMEIVTYMLEGAIAHKDSMGNGSTLRSGEVQRMTAGRGLYHSEFNPAGESAHLLQIWITPREKGLTPSYEQKYFEPAGKTGKLVPVANPAGSDGALKIEAGAAIYATILDGGKVSHELAPGRHGWVQVAYGDVKLNGVELHGGDGAAISGEPAVELEGVGELLLFDLD